MKVKGERNRSRPAIGTGRRTVGSPPGTGGPGGVLPTYSPRQSPLDVRDSLRGELPCSWQSGNRTMCDSLPSLRSGALSSDWIGTGKGLTYKTEVAVVRLGPLGRGGVWMVLAMKWLGW